MLELCRCPNIYGPDCIIYIIIIIFFFSDLHSSVLVKSKDAFRAI